MKMTEKELRECDGLCEVRNGLAGMVSKWICGDSMGLIAAK